MESGLKFADVANILMQLIAQGGGAKRSTRCTISFPNTPPQRNSPPNKGAMLYW